jgi:hypothetical protein
LFGVQLLGERDEAAVVAKRVEPGIDLDRNDVEANCRGD